MATFELEVDVNVYSAECESCGNNVQVQDFSIDNDGDITITIDPCEHCLQDRYNEGKQEGIDEAAPVEEIKNDSNPYTR